MKALKWILCVMGVLVSIFNVMNDDPSSLVAWIGLGMIVLGWRIGKKQKEEEIQEMVRKEKEKKEAQQAAHPYSPPARYAYVPDPDTEEEEEEPDYESAAFLQYPIGDYYGDLSDEDDERLSNIDPIERDTVIEKERLFWDMMIFDDDE